MKLGPAENSAVAGITPAGSSVKILVAIQIQEELLRAAFPDKRNGIARVVAELEHPPHDRAMSQCRLFGERRQSALDGHMPEQELEVGLLILQRDRGHRSGWGAGWAESSLPETLPGQVTAMMAIASNAAPGHVQPFRGSREHRSLSHNGRHF